MLRLWGTCAVQVVTTWPIALKVGLAQVVGSRT